MNEIVMPLLATVLTAAAVLLLVPVAVLLAQVLLAHGPVRPRPPSGGARRPRAAVLVPAHDESAGIAASLAAVAPQLLAGDRLLVVADNCTDDTARVAAAAGAEVAERHDTARRGKGYALDFGVRRLAADPPDVVVIVDADCFLQAGALDALVREAAARQRPVQALYLMQSPSPAGLATRIAQFAWVVKNLVRPLGWHRAGLPCQLMGTGMAFPWVQMVDAPLASGHIVEDLQLGLDLAAAGTPPCFCPANAAGMAAQRTRWEHGHLGVIAANVPRLLRRAITQRDWPLAALVLDLAVPPLASLVLMLLVTGVVAGLFALAGGSRWPLAIVLVASSGLVGAVLLAWSRHGRHIVSLRELMGVPGYVLGKLPLYARLFKGRQVEWVRTERDDKSR